MNLQFLSGLMRDIFSHKITTPEHWYMVIQSSKYDKEDISYDKVVGNATVVAPAYDPHCIHDVPEGCEPVEIISAERLVELGTGPAEGRKIARVLKDKEGVKDYLIAEDAWECIWKELIVNKKGYKTFIDRAGIEERDYNFSEEMLNAMIIELDRLITKYSSDEWSVKATAQYLVELLEEHRGLVYDELLEVQSGVRKLRKNDFLGRKTRSNMFSSNSI